MITDDEDAIRDASPDLSETPSTVDDLTRPPLPIEIEKANDLILRQMAESIHVAHEINPNSWAVYERRGSVSLIVSRYIALTTVYKESSKATIFVATAEIDPELERDYSFYRGPGALTAIPGTHVEIPAEQIPEALHRLRKAHLAAIEMAAREVRTRSARANEHRPDMLEKIESATDETLPRPAYMSEARLERSSTPAFHPAMLQRLVRTIHLADSINPNAWALTPLNGQPALQLGFTRAMTIGPKPPFDLIVDPGFRDDPETAWLHALLLPYQLQNKMMTRLTIPVDRVEIVLSIVPEAHERAVRAAIADSKTKAQRWNDHSEDMRRQIEEACGEELPMPAYVTATAPQLHSVAVVHKGMAAAGLFYTPDQIATFYTALQTKGFVVLSGISGTGKSKIAQLFVNMLPAEDKPREEIVLDSTDLIPRIVQTTTVKYGLVNFPRELFERVLLPELGAKVNLSVEFNGISKSSAFRIIAQGNSVVYRLYFAGEMKKRIASLKLGTMLYFRPLLDDETAMLVGFSILMPEEVPVSAAHSGSITSRNNLFLSVRPDWRDSRALIGYQNPLLGEYEWTDFLQFILRAGENYRSEEPIAWFVILDEMNLAHVEYYFADLLSVLESGRDDAGWTWEAIRIQRPEPMEEQDEDVPPAEIRLPPNLYIIGTVNMDETTHAFSPKVLDRAFTMELSEVDFSSYPITTSGDAGEPTRAERTALLAGFSRNGRFARIEKWEIRDIVAEYPEIRNWLQNLNELLEKSRMNFGYRVFDEIAAFTGNGMRNFVDFEVKQVFDRAVLMKVLPKFSGSAARLERPLLDLLAWCVDPRRLPQKEIRQAFDSLGDDGWSASTHPVLAEGMMFPVTSKRVMRMLDTLAVEGFASFG